MIDGKRPQDAPCPLCKQKIATSIPDRQLERLLNEKLVYCSNKKSGCKWTGELGKFEADHLKNECLYAQVLCSQCQRMNVKRHAMRNHMQHKCARRIVVCTYCETYRAAYEDLGRIHHPVCPYFPEPCPKGCGAKPFRKNIAKHLATSCPKNPQPCPFHIVGCTKKLAGRQMENHLCDRAVLTSHLSGMKMKLGDLQNDIWEKNAQIKALQKDITTKDTLVNKLQCDIETKELDMSMMMDELKASKHHSSTLQEEIRDKEQEIKALKKEISQLDCLKETFAQEAKSKTAALKEKASQVSTLTKQVKEKNQQIEKLKKNGAVGGEPNIKQPKNTELRERNLCLEVQVGDMATRAAYLEDKLYQRTVHTETLEREVAELQQVIQDQKRNIDRYIRTAKRRYSKLSKADRKEEAQLEVEDILELGGTFESSIPIVIEGQRPPVEIDGSNHTATVPVEEERGDPPGQPVNDNPPADDNTGVLGAALGVAVGVGIAGLAALLRH